MQVSLTATGGLERKLEVAVPAEQVAAEVDQRLQKLARTARFNGFRPGKAPMGVVRQQYGTQVHSEVVSDLLRSSFSDAVTQENLKPATGPRIQPIALDPGADLKYVATFEVLPEIRLAPVESLAIERPTASVTDADIDEMLESLRKQRPVYTSVERGAKTTDRVQIDFEGRIDGTAFQGGEGRDVPVVLGGGQVLSEFEQALAGAMAGETRTAVVHFPDDYHGKDVAGKTAEFTITLKGVEEMSLPALDDAFASEFGVKEGGIAQLRVEVRESMERALEIARRESKPVLLEIRTYRYMGHSMSDAVSGTYRTKAELDEYLKRDPINLLKARMMDAGDLTDADVAEMEQEIKAVVQDSWDFADASPEPPPEALYEDVLVDTTS
mgnify:CR=1 FL=1